jgi:hypothetical protein
MAHSCGRHTLAEHFDHRDPALLRLFRSYRSFVRSVGRTHVYAQKTRIVFQNRGRFSAVMPRSRWLEVTVWLKRRHPDPRFHKVEFLPRSDWLHYLRLTDTAQLDESLRDILREAWAVGNQDVRAGD